MTKLIGILVLGFSVGALAEVNDSRELAGRKDFSKDYLEKISDEQAMEKSNSEKDRIAHDKYLRAIDRSR